MKKYLLLTLIFFVAVTVAYAVGTPRVYGQVCVLSDGSMPPVNNTGTTHNPDYIVRATITETGETLGTDMGTPVASLRLFKAGNGTTVPYDVRTFLQLGTFPTQWVAGQHVLMWVKHIPTDQVTTWTLEIPAGTATITITNPTQVIPPAVIQDTWTYNLQVNGPAGTAVTGPGTYAGTIPQLFTCTTEVNDLLGNWTVPAPPAGFTWAVNPILVQASDFTGAKVDHVFSATIEFALVPIPDTYTLHVTAMGPATMIFKNGISTGQMAPWDFTGAAAADLIGTYSMDPMGLPAGWHWEPATIEVVATDFVAAKSAQIGLGTMSNGAKVAYAHTINFTQMENPPVIVPVDPATLPAGYPLTNVVNAAYVVTWTGVHDLFIARTPTDTGALAYIGGAWLAPDGAPDWTWLNVNFDAKAPVPVVVFGPTLPVELSSFTGIMTAEYFVQLNWTTQSETNLIGYRVLRSEGTDVAQATNMTPVLIDAYNESTTHNYSFTDGEVENHTVYNYWLESVEMDGSSEFHGPVSVLVEHEVPPVVPTQTSMRNAYPNPFQVNGNTTIEVAVKEADAGTVTIYNILGQVVKTYSVNPGINNLTWNGKDSKGNTCGSGIYFYRLSTPSMNKTMKMVIVK